MIDHRIMEVIGRITEVIIRTRPPPSSTENKCLESNESPIDSDWNGAC